MVQQDWKTRSVRICERQSRLTMVWDSIVMFKQLLLKVKLFSILALFGLIPAKIRPHLIQTNHQVSKRSWEDIHLFNTYVALPGEDIISCYKYKVIFNQYLFGMTEQMSSDEEPRPQFYFEFQEGVEHRALKYKGTVRKLRPFPTKKYKGVKKGRKELSPELKKIWEKLFATTASGRDAEKEEIKIEDVLPFIPKPTRMPTCGKILQKDIKIYHCYDCCGNPSSVFCAECFENSNHQGHRFSAQTSYGGTCDCGDDKEIKPNGFCTQHNGKAEVPHIPQEESQQFLTIMRQIYKWFEIIYDRDGYEALWLLLHCLLFLGKLNDKSLYYNKLTAEWLKTPIEREKSVLWEIRKDKKLTVLGEILELGAYHLDTNFSNWTTDVFLKMLGYLPFKEHLAEQYLYSYNNVFRFEHTDFVRLFIQVFSNPDVVKKVTSKTGTSLDPKNREREYEMSDYTSSLHFVGTLDRNTGKDFFRPIIMNGGIEFCQLRYIQKRYQQDRGNPENCYKDKWYPENYYYLAIAAVARIYEDEPEMIAQQIRNQYQLLSKYTNDINKAIIPHHRALTLLLFSYFKGNLQAIDPKEVMRIFDTQDQKSFAEVVQDLLTRFVLCLREFSLSLGNRQYGSYVFDHYLTIYIAHKVSVKVFTLDCLGMRVLGMLLSKMDRADCVEKVLQQVYTGERGSFQGTLNSLKREIDGVRRYEEMERNMMDRRYRDRHRGRGMDMDMDEEYEMDRRQYYEMMMYSRMDRMDRGHRSSHQIFRENRQKIATKTVVYISAWTHFISFIFEAVFLERPEVVWGNTCKINSPLIKEATIRQLAQIFMNAKQLTKEQLEVVGNFWVGKEFEPEIVKEVADYDPDRKVFNCKPGLREKPICKDLLHSFIDNDDYLTFSSRRIQPTPLNRTLSNVFLPPALIEQLFKSLLDAFEQHITEKQVTVLQYLASALRLINLGINFPNFSLYEQRILDLARRYDVEQKIRLIFQKSAEVLEKEEKEEDRRRKEQLARKKNEKLQKIAQPKEYVKKLLEDHPAEEEDGECILCRGGQGDLFYLGLYGESSFIYNTLRCQGTYPFFQCCFHKIHFECFIQISKENEGVSCPFCRAVANVLLPTESGVDDEELLRKFNERLELVSVIHASKKQIDSLDAHLTKSFLHIFFVTLMGKRAPGQSKPNDKPLSEKKRKLYHIIVRILRGRYQRMSKEEQKKFEEKLPKRHEISNPPENYPLQELIDLVDTFTLQALKQEEITEQRFDQLLANCKSLPVEDLRKCFELGGEIFEIRPDQKYLKQLTRVKEVSQPLSQIVELYYPPRSIGELIEVRDKEKLCKSGHSICVCIICRWVGCAECGLASVHAEEFHCRHTIFFNLITGGLIYVSLQKRFEVPCLYLSKTTGDVWKPSQKEGSFLLDEKTYGAMLEALTEQNLSEFMSTRIEKTEIPYLY